MRLARFERTMEVLLILSLIGSAGGCGPGGQASPDEAKSKAIEADMRKFYQGLKAKKSEGSKRSGGPITTSRGPG